ncbi:putative transcription factor TFIIIC subunit [Clavispora lusitaniae]|uniref:Transcription factor TFIIIC subunit n=1 Tax=Clavispora lusitaniae TaxID=36911 RepID=A0AA91PW38_CLALS|nr:putative transcription factor TFIIIC subunit [Clavispora lusitaniae]
MTLEKIYIARHGYRANWLPEPHPPNPTGIDSDPALAPHGVDQAIEMGKHLSSLSPADQPQFILTSPFYRCVETAAPYARESGLKICLEPGVGEWFKRSRAVVPKPGSYETHAKFFPDVLGTASLWEGTSVNPSLEGEDEDEIFDRTKRFWQEFFPRFEQKHPHVKNLLIVTHAATKIAAGMSLMGLASVHDAVDVNGEKGKLRAGACSIDKYEKQDGKWVILENGRTDFLSGGEEMNWNFDVKFEAGSDEDIKAREEAAAAAAANNTSKSVEYEDFFLTVDVPIVAPTYYDESVQENHENNNIAEQLLINPNAKFQITRLDEANPLFKISDNANAAADPESIAFSNLSAIDGQIYQTNWSKLLGTELIFDENGELVGTVREHLVADPSVKIKPKSKDLNDEDMDSESNEESDSKTAFLKKAIAIARAKNS